METYCEVNEKLRMQISETEHNEQQKTKQLSSACLHLAGEYCEELILD